MNEREKRKSRESSERRGKREKISAMKVPRQCQLALLIKIG
jgi:hypothetical protein